MGPAPSITHCPRKPSLTSGIETKVLGDTGTAAGRGGVWGMGGFARPAPQQPPRCLGHGGTGGSLRSPKIRNPRRGRDTDIPTPAAFFRGKLQFQSAGRGGRDPLQVPPAPRPQAQRVFQSSSSSPGWLGRGGDCARPQNSSPSVSISMLPPFFLPAFPYLRRGSTIT